MENINRLRHFIQRMTETVEGANSALLIPRARVALAELIEVDDWLPTFATHADPNYYSQYLLHCDPLERFSLVSFVWGPGQRTPVHDHTVWGLVGMLRGSERSTRYVRQEDGSLSAADITVLHPRDIETLDPTQGDIHQVENCSLNTRAISIHLYGANIGAVRRSVFDPASGRAQPFVSGYSSPILPNIWDRSSEMRLAP